SPQDKATLAPVPGRSGPVHASPRRGRDGGLTATVCPTGSPAVGALAAVAAGSHHFHRVARVRTFGASCSQFLLRISLFSGQKFPALVQANLATNHVRSNICGLSVARTKAALAKNLCKIPC